MYMVLRTEYFQMMTLYFTPYQRKNLSQSFDITETWDTPEAAHYWWPKMRDDIREVLEQCKVCENYTQTKVPPNSVVPVSITQPFKIWLLDIMGPIPGKNKGKKYIITAINYATVVDPGPTSQTCCYLALESCYCYLPMTKLQGALPPGRQFCETTLYCHLTN
ncbi:hypothetical protein DSO57_1018676 [Entomophthora muscae]|uniref:Uncharacterized protein n=1 Tax=Entomophthora muscae TaxID=34485 RepID=A0ACC2STC4_9FUNG|nr:hypothetical protein DSO57_1018676 [Entomophthora muscae]